MLIALMLSSVAAFAQPGGYAVRLQSNNNFGTPYVTGPAVAGGIVSVTVQAASNANGYIIEWDNFWNKWYNTSTPKNAQMELIFGGGSNNGPDSQLVGGFINGKFYTFQVRGYAYANRQAVVLETDNAPVAFHATASTAVSGPGYVCAGSAATINITLAGAKSAQERVYVRYAINGDYNNSKVVEATGSGSTWSTASATIPASDHAAGTVINYYAYSTTVSAGNTSDHDLITLRFANNGGANYSYTVNANATYYADADNDGYGNASATTVSCNGAPSGYVSNNTDCDDANNAKHASFPFYVDNDADGFGTGSTVTLCAVDANTAPAGYSVNDTDCNDADNSAHAMYPFYVDADGDGYGTGNLVNVCAADANTPPANYSSNNTDCNDANSAMHSEFLFYTDADGDGYGFGSQMSVCAADANTAPAGYSLNNTDCNDSVAAINPGQDEVYYNGVDDNCDGNLDEGNQLKTQIAANQCGSTLASIGSTIYADNINNATAYRFEVTDPQGAVQTIVRNVRWFQLTMLPSYTYGTTYSIRVEIQRNNVWLGYYGDACFVSSPAVVEQPGGGAGVTGAQCGSVLPSISSIIYTNSFNNATAYRFRVSNTTDATAPNQVQTLERSQRWFSLPMLATYNYGTTYMVEVSIKSSNGTYSPYGSACMITTPAVPGMNNCGQTIATNTTNVSTASKDKVTSYRFKLTNVESGASITIDRPLHWFRFNMVPGYVAGAQYDVSVALMTSGVYSPYGDVCTITAPGAARFNDVKNELEPAVDFKAVVYPNPYAATFAIDVTTSATENIQVKVYDMMGKLLEVRDVAPTAIDQQQLGQRYPAGVYNIIVTQGATMKSLRVIKR